MRPPSAALRIGEFSRRVGVNAELLRAWERRYGLLQPLRSNGGFRLYTEDDAERVARMRRGLADGLSAAEAARLAVEERRPAEGVLEDVTERLYGAICRYDEAGAQAALDDGLAAVGIETVLRNVVLPVLQRVGDEWEAGRLDVAQEHFATNVVRGRLLALSRLWGRGGGPSALLACAPGERHDLTLLVFGLVLRTHGWRILYLGADTPLETLAAAANATQPTVAVVSSFESGLLEAHASDLRRLGKHVPLALAGPGASPRFCQRLGLRYLDGDVIAAANDLAEVG